MENEELPQYMRIAVSVAGRIADGQLAEGEALRALEAFVGVSGFPETIRGGDGLHFLRWKSVGAPFQRGGGGGGCWCGSILDDSVQPEQAAEQLKTFSCRVPQDWPDAGKTLGSLHFWQATGATVVAIARARTR